MQIPNLALSPEKAAEVSGVGRTTIFAEMKAGRLPRRKVGRRTVILMDDLHRWLTSLPKDTTNTPVHEEDH